MSNSTPAGTASEAFSEACALLRENEVGRRAYIDTPFGRRLICYADQTATGRYLHFVEAWMRRVRPFYANTHTAVSSTGRLMTSLREEARRVIAASVNAGPGDEVIFTGSGATAAVNKLVGLLGIRIPEPLERAYALSQHIPPNERPVVFIGPYEHHSNELPWVESIADVVEIALTPDGGLDLDDLQHQLGAYSDRPLKYGSFSAASNVTGLLSDVDAITRALHQAGAYACFDYAAAGPYVPINMHPADPECRLDAIFLSAHKFVGGPTASGVLVLNRALNRSRIPERPGGGTVSYVAGPGDVDYTTNFAEREEGGTPSIIGDVRAGTAFLVKEMVGAEALLDHERTIARTAVQRLAQHPRIKILGSTKLPRLAILSFNIDGLHHDFVSALLDHLFGIQNRAGCSCAGPYGHRLLGIDSQTSARFRAQIARGVEGIKLGWVRLTIPCYASKSDVEFLLAAIEFVADSGELFVPAYELCWADGVWRHRETPSPDVLPIELTVAALREAAHLPDDADHEDPLTEGQIANHRTAYLNEARHLADDLAQRWHADPPPWNPPTGDPEIDDLIWFRYVATDALPTGTSREHAAGE